MRNPPRQGARNHGHVALKRARALRKEMSISEQVLWKCLRRGQLGFSFKRQVPIGPYVMDFYCPEAALCVEVDGEQHAVQTAQDGWRDAYLLRRGVQTLRIPSLELFDASLEPELDVLDRITAACEERTGRKAWPDL